MKSDIRPLVKKSSTYITYSLTSITVSYIFLVSSSHHEASYILGHNFPNSGTSPVSLSRSSCPARYTVRTDTGPCTGRAMSGLTCPLLVCLRGRTSRIPSPSRLQRVRGCHRHGVCADPPKNIIIYLKNNLKYRHWLEHFNHTKFLYSLADFRNKYCICIRRIMLINWNKCTC